MRTKQKILGKVKDRTPNSVFFYQGYLSYPGLAFHLTEEVVMKKTWVETSRGRFDLKTGTITPFGFTNVERTDRFNDVKQAQKKAQLCNYIWKKCQEELAGVKL